MFYKSDKVYDHKQFSDYDIASATELGLGVPVQLSAGKVVAATASGASQAFLGITAESHAGADGALELKCRREKIAIFDSPHAVLAAGGIKIAATADGSSGTVTSGTYTADHYNGGKAKCIKAVSGSSYEVGKIYDITDGTTTALVIGTGTVKNGDEFKVYPPVGATQIGFETVDSKLTGELALNTAGAILKVVSSDAEADEVCVICTAHALK